MPVFGRCTELHELWVPLIEKAYAKVHGCYETLISGFIDDALADLTGQVSEKIKMHNKNGLFPGKGIGDKEQFWQFLMARRDEQCMMGCSVAGATEGPVKIDGEQTGVLSGHAYGIIDVFELKDPDMKKERKCHRILRIRNPWGKQEWNMKWSDDSDEMEKYKHLVDKYVAGLPEDERFEPGEDGSFLMCYSDWRSVFNSLFISVNFKDSWTALRYSSRWTLKDSGGLPGKSEESKVLWAQNP